MSIADSSSKGINGYLSPFVRCKLATCSESNQASNSKANDMLSSEVVLTIDAAPTSHIDIAAAARGRLSQGRRRESLRAWVSRVIFGQIAMQ